MGYLVAYLKKVVPKLAADIQTWCKEYEMDFDYCSDNFYVVIPTNGFCPQQFADVDVLIGDTANSLKDQHAPTAGDQSRKLTKSMHYIVDKQDADKVYHFCGEFAAPLKTLRDIYDLTDNFFWKGKMFQEEVNNFVSQLEQFFCLEKLDFVTKKLVVVRFTGASAKSLSETLLDRIKRDIALRKSQSPDQTPAVSDEINQEPAIKWNCDKKKWEDLRGVEASNNP